MGLSSAYFLVTYTFEFGHCFLYCGPKAGGIYHTYPDGTSE